MSFQALRQQRNARQAPLKHGVGSKGASVAAASKTEGTVSESTKTSSIPVPADSIHTLSSDLARTSVAPKSGVTGSSNIPAESKSSVLPKVDTAAYPELANTSLQVRTTPSHGRGLYATSPITKGSTILRTTPRISALERPDLHTARTPTGHNLHCATCHQLKRVQRCAACKSIFYCSGVCQKSDWPSHKRECAALKRLREMWAKVYPDRARDSDENAWVPHVGIRAMGRLCWDRVGGGEWASVAAMESHAGRSEETSMNLGKEIQHLQHYLGAVKGEGDVVYPVEMGDFGFTTVREVMDMVSAFMVNSFTLSTPDLSPIGVAMSPVCALFNHSCEPNAVVVFPEGKEMCVVAIADIAEGEEVLTSYIDVSMPYDERQRELKERYDFSCDCKLCQKGEWADPRWSVLHGCKAAGRGPMPNLVGASATVRCTCGETFTVDVRKLRRLIEDGKRILADDDRGTLDPAIALPTLVQLIPQLIALIPPSAHPLLQLLRLNARLLMPPSSAADRQSAISLLTAAAIGAAQSHPRNHPTVGIILAERAKMLAMDPEAIGQEAHEARDRRMLSVTEQVGKKRTQLVEAVTALRDAASACDRGFGKGGKVAADLRRFLASCERELDTLR